MLLRLFWFLPLALSAGALAQDGSPLPKPQATVVVFTPGSHWRGTGDQLKHLLFGKSNELSFGEFFDGKTRVAFLTHSRYLVISLPVGEHTFSASMSKKHPDPKQALSVDLRPDNVKFLAITATMTNWGAGIIATETSHIEEATCQEFRADQSANHTEPVQEKRVSNSFHAQVKSLADVPPCTP